MAHGIWSLLKEMASTTGTGPFTLAGAEPDFLAFNARLTADGDTTFYAARNGAQFETGTLTRTSSTTFARTVSESSNGDALVAFTAPPMVYSTVPGPQLLSASGGAASGFRGHRTTNQVGIVTATSTLVLFNAEDFDTHSAFDGSRFQPTVPGYYEFNWSLWVRGGSLATAVSFMRKNGADYNAGSQSPSYVNTVRSTGSDVFYLNGTTDYVELFVYAEGSGIFIDGSSVGQTTFSGILVKPGVPDAVEPAFRAYHSTVQSLNSAGATKAAFDTEVFDTNGCFASSRFTANVAGLYDFKARITASQTISGQVIPAGGYIALYKNGALHTVGDQPQAANMYRAGVVDLISLAVGDYVEVYVGTTGVTLTLENSSYGTFFAGHLARRI